VPTVNRAFRAAQSGRPGPVAVETCWDTLATTTVPAHGRAEAPREEPEPEPDSDAIGAAAKLLAAARKPMLMCGAGAQHAAPSDEGDEDEGGDEPT